MEGDVDIIINITIINIIIITIIIVTALGS